MIQAAKGRPGQQAVRGMARRRRRGQSRGCDGEGGECGLGVSRRCGRGRQRIPSRLRHGGPPPAAPEARGEMIHDRSRRSRRRRRAAGRLAQGVCGVVGGNRQLAVISDGVGDRGSDVAADDVAAVGVGVAAAAAAAIVVVVDVVVDDAGEGEGEGEDGRRRSEGREKKHAKWRSGFYIQAGPREGKEAHERHSQRRARPVDVGMLQSKSGKNSRK